MLSLNCDVRSQCASIRWNFGVWFECSLIWYLEFMVNDPFYYETTHRLNVGRFSFNLAFDDESRTYAVLLFKKKQLEFSDMFIEKKSSFVCMYCRSATIAIIFE